MDKEKIYAVIKKHVLENLEDLQAKATERGFKPIPLGLKASLKMTHSLRESTSRNVIAVLPGSDRADEYIFYMAHWDHLGLDPTLVRIIYVVGSIASVAFPGFLVYVICWLVIPEE